MKKYILAILALFTVSACSTNNTKSWNDITNIGSEDALKEYTSLIKEHSAERWAKQSHNVVKLCYIKKEGMTVKDLTKQIKDNYPKAKKCWQALTKYPSSDVRFFKDGTIEKEILSEFYKNQKEYMKLFK